MIIFKEKQYTRQITLSYRAKRALIPVLQGGTGMSKREAIRTVAAGSTKGLPGATKELGVYAKNNPGAMIGSAVTAPLPIPGASIVGAHAGKRIQRLVKG